MECNLCLVTQEKSLWAVTVPSWQVTWAYQRQPLTLNTHVTLENVVHHGFTGDLEHCPLNPTITGWCLFCQKTQNLLDMVLFLRVSEVQEWPSVLQHSSYSLPLSFLTFPCGSWTHCFYFCRCFPSPLSSPGLPTPSLLLTCPLPWFSSASIPSPYSCHILPFTDTAKHRAPFPPVSDWPVTERQGSVSGFWAILDQPHQPLITESKLLWLLPVTHFFFFFPLFLNSIIGTRDACGNLGKTWNLGNERVSVAVWTVRHLENIRQKLFQAQLHIPKPECHTDLCSVTPLQNNGFGLISTQESSLLAVILKGQASCAPLLAKCLICAFFSF